MSRREKSILSDASKVERTIDKDTAVVGQNEARMSQPVSLYMADRTLCMVFRKSQHLKTLILDKVIMYNIYKCNAIQRICTYML